MQTLVSDGLFRSSYVPHLCLMDPQLYLGDALTSENIIVASISRVCEEKKVYFIKCLK